MPGSKVAKSNAGPTGQEERERILIAMDGNAWFIRHVQFVEHKLDFNRRLYHCDGNLGGPFVSIDDAIKAAKEMLHHDRAPAALRTA